MVCQKCAKTGTEGEKLCSACGAAIQSDGIPKSRRAKLKEKLETIKMLGTAACAIAAVGAAAASAMSGPYIPAAALGDDSPAPAKKEDRPTNQIEKKKIARREG